MRFKSDAVDGFQIFAVAGTNVVSFGTSANRAARKGLLGDDPAWWSVVSRLTVVLPANAGMIPTTRVAGARHVIIPADAGMITCGSRQQPLRTAQRLLLNLRHF